MREHTEQQNTIWHDTPTITVLLSTCNGEKYLREQLDSLLMRICLAINKSAFYMMLRLFRLTKNSNIGGKSID